MKIVQVHNRYRGVSGESAVFDATVDLLRRRGIAVSLLTRDNRDIGRSLRAKLHAFVSSLYSPSAARDMVYLIKMERPSVVHFHNLFPLLSVSVLVACRHAGVPVVMSCHDYRLTCPVVFHLRNGAICELCSGGREYWCVFKNCRGNISESIAYALRNAVVRKLRLFHDNVTIFIALTEFAKHRLTDAGFKEKRIVVLPNMVPIPAQLVDPTRGEYVAYVGRISPEKGIDTLLTAARRTGLPVRFAGDYSPMPDVRKTAPPNAEFVGFVGRGDVSAFYRKARCLVLPSKWYEMCPLVISEAMSHGLPVIVSRVGGLPEIVEDGETGLLFEPGNAEELAEKIKLLWENPDLCRQMGQAGREKAVREYSEDVYYTRLVAVYEKAIDTSREKSGRGHV